MFRMKKTLIKPVLFLFLFYTCPNLFGQCASNDNIYAFEFGPKSYEIIKENKNWSSAAACAVERGGYLAEINSSLEQSAILSALISAAEIDVSNTVAPDGGNASYVWIGGNDIASEGDWFWDGDNDGTGIQFWEGKADGSAVDGNYNNWGNEPDDFGSGQDGLGLALTDWPLGSRGQWNDVQTSNTLYYVVEFDHTSAIVDPAIRNNIDVFPNPMSQQLSIQNKNIDVDIKQVVVLNMLGQSVSSYPIEGKQSKDMDVSHLSQGVYFVKVELEDGLFFVEKIIKE